MARRAASPRRRRCRHASAWSPTTAPAFARAGRRQVEDSQKGDAARAELGLRSCFRWPREPPPQAAGEAVKGSVGQVL